MAANKSSGTRRRRPGARLSRIEQSALKKFKTAVEDALAGQLMEMKLFGSKARGDARKDSDIDVLVIVSSDDWRLCDVVCDIATDVLLESEVCISPKVISKRRFQDQSAMGNPFVRNVVREGIPV